MAQLAERDLVELRAVAAEGGLAQQELADRFGVSRSYVSRLLAGDRRVLLEASVGGRDRRSGRRVPD